MEFRRVAFRSDDALTAIDVHPKRHELVCCATSAGRVFLVDFVARRQLVESRLKLVKRRSSTSDVDVIETPRVTALAFSPDGRHLACGLASGTLVMLDPSVLRELHRLSLAIGPLVSVKFSPDSSLVVVHVRIAPQTRSL
jgi:WD40 repeat protein